MNRRAILLLNLVLLAGGALPLAQDSDTERWWGHVRFLADDSLQGREAGSEAYRKAAEYVADQFRRAGLAAAGTSGYLQAVKLRSRRIVEQRSSLALVSDGRHLPLELGEDAYFNMRVEPVTSVTAPLVFAGYGLVVPEVNHDDLGGLDLRGKVVVYISGAPGDIPGALQAHYQATAERWAFLKRAGAIGTIAIQNPRGSDIPWDRAKLSRFQPAMTLADPEFDETPGMQLALVANPARSETWFTGSGWELTGILDLARAGKPLPHFPLTASVSATVAYEATEVESPNVVGILRGSDPKLQNEYVVLSAHLDHVGVGEPIDGDRIYNGAMDNASGVATLIEVAATFARGAPRPKRSLLFVAVTAEEKGLLGSKYFAGRPPVPAGAIVANMNMDMFLPLVPMKSVIVVGLEESDLGEIALEVGRNLNLAVHGDPEPERNVFTRSDQYSFIRRGVPAVFPKVGFEKWTPEDEIMLAWRRDRYHAPSDDLQQPVNFEAAAMFNRYTKALIETVANRPGRPRWHDHSFFKRFATTGK